MGTYYLKHKNDNCGTIVIDETGRVVAYQDNNRDLL